MMLMQVTCPHCGARYQFERSLIPAGGYDAQCANCSGIFVVAPDARESQPPIALPSMSMVDTWLAPPAQAPKSARPAATVGELPASRTPTPAPRPTAAPGPAATAPRAQPTKAGAAPAPAAQPGLQFSISCPSCESVYAFAVNELPPQGVPAPCSNCGTVYYLTRIGDPNATIEMLRPLQPTMLAQPKHGDETIGAALAPDLHQPEDTTPDGAMIRGMSEPAFVDAAFHEQRLSDTQMRQAHFEEPELGDFASAKLADEPFLVSEPFMAEPMKAKLAHSEPWPDQSAVKPMLVPGDEPTAVSTNPVDAEIVAELRDTPEVLTPSSAKAPDEIVKKDETAKEELPPRVEIGREPSGALLPGLGADEPDGSIADLAVVADKEPTRTRALVPMAVNERSRAGAASWGGPPAGDPQAMMQSRVRKSGDSKKRGNESREHGKSRRPPFDDEDVARMRNRGGLIGDPSEFDDREEKVLRSRIVRRNFGLALLGALALAAVALFVVVPALTGKSAQQLLRFGNDDDPRMVELLAAARVALWPDTDAKYRDAAKAASDALDIDPSNPQARALYGLAAVFRGIDVRAAAQDLVAQGEVVQSSQMLATASAELAHARRVLTRKNDETAELMFAAGIYYALDEDQRSHAREAFRRGMELSQVAESGPTPTPFAAYLDALLRNLEGDNAGARAALERAVKLEQRWQRPRFELGRMDAASGENAAARSMLQDVLQRDPDHAKAKALLAVVPDASPSPRSAPTAAVPTQAEPTQVLPSATPESLKEPEQHAGTQTVKPAVPDVLPGPAPTQTPQRLPQAPRNEPRTEAPRHDAVQKRLEALKHDLPDEPKPDSKPDEVTPPSSDTQTPPNTPNIVRGTPPPFNPSDDKKAPPPPPPSPPPSEAPPEPPKTEAGETPSP